MSQYAGSRLDTGMCKIGGLCRLEAAAVDVNNPDPTKKFNVSGDCVN